MNDLMFEVSLFLGTYKYLIMLILFIVVTIITNIRFKIIDNRMKKMILELESIHYNMTKKD